ncbi:MAG: SDR family oxidoreductase [Comamonadaceae bacterium]|nr:MAG: SDR family oxidoreductase [Comamonadaceae bacterium]
METFTHSSAFAAQALQGRAVLVVGAGQAASDDATLVGNGRAISLVLASLGAVVHCADRSEAAAGATVDAIRAAGGQARALVADVADPAAVRGLVDEAAIDGPLHGLVLNVGISDRKPLAQITADSWDAIFSVNLRGHMLCAQAALPRMAQGGAIVFISSLAARMPAGRNPTYEASKAALPALCRAVALEGHARDIRANIVAAGLVDTPMGRSASQARPERARMALPFGRQATASDIAAAVAFLLSDASRYINAVELPVDGGLAHGIARAPSA